MAWHVGACASDASVDGGGGVSNVTALKPRTQEQTWLSPDQVCERVPGMTVDNLKVLRANGKGPVFYKPTGDHGKITLYAATEVDAWVASGRRSTREQS